MESKICMNELCKATTTTRWRKGWSLKSGGLADLCYRCGAAYENSVFCEMFHSNEDGWRQCRLCQKRLHCGCVASATLRQLLDHGGVACIGCTNSSPQPNLIRRNKRFDWVNAMTVRSSDDLQPNVVDNGIVNGNSCKDGRLSQFCQAMEVYEPTLFPKSRLNDANSSRELQDKREEVPRFMGSSKSTSTSDNNSRSMRDVGDIREPFGQPSLTLNMTLGTTGSSNVGGIPFSTSVVADGRGQSKGQQSRPILPKPPRSGPTVTPETNKSSNHSLRIARPPVEGRGKNHLLPRYWPRITDQELQKLSGDLNSTIVPLFEKVLSASDAGRIGRLVLPKACAETYFPAIDHSEGLPLKVQDIKGKEWTFQFRFWPNNNSRMYVLEGVTPCIQSMQLRAGDTVIFSRIDPSGKLVICFRKATNIEDQQDPKTPALPSSSSVGDTSNSTTVETSVNVYTGIFETLKGGMEGNNVNGFAKQPSSTDIGSNRGGKASEDSQHHPISKTDKKRARDIGPKSKRLFIQSEDALELRLTWEEAQDLLRPQPGAKPSIVSIDEYDFEEYVEPPVFGKRTIFTLLPSGSHEQWAQCDDCSKWRRLPADVLLPPKWTCLQNEWDLTRSQCSAPEELTQKDLENLLKVGRDLKKRRSIEARSPGHEVVEPTGLDALASVAVLGDSLVDGGQDASTGGETTKHPRHRPGCSCIVCSQPPSGKGKHKNTCTCNVCMTVKRRFKTLMLRKKKRKTTGEETSQTEQSGQSGGQQHDDLELINGNNNHCSDDNEGSQNVVVVGPSEIVETNNGQIDLNCDPNRDFEDPGMSIMSLLHVASQPFDDFMNRNGLPSLMNNEKQQEGGGSSSCSLAKTNGSSENHKPEDRFAGL